MRVNRVEPLRASERGCSEFDDGVGGGSTGLEGVLWGEMGVDFRGGSTEGSTTIRFFEGRSILILFTGSFSLLMTSAVMYVDLGLFLRMPAGLGASIRFCMSAGVLMCTTSEGGAVLMLCTVEGRRGILKTGNAGCGSSTTGFWLSLVTSLEGVACACCRDLAKLVRNSISS